jgi:serine/threonine-protein kinase
VAASNQEEVARVVGTTLAGKYRIEKVLGQGGMGDVYLAENLQIGRKVAIKVLHADLAADEGALLRFRQEARASAAIRHPGIIDVLDMGQTEDGSQFIVEEFLEGEPLSSCFRLSGPMPPLRILPLICDVLDALAAAHDKGIVHRDLKPDNLFLVEQPVPGVKILDFGISKFQGADNLVATRTGAVMGTPLYMSPEQARGAKEITHLTDIYAMGAILYEGLTGRPPFVGETYNEIIANVLLEPHQPIAQIRTDLSPELCAVVDAMLAKDPAARPQHALIAQGRLKNAMGSQPSELDPTARVAQADAFPAASIPPHAPTRPQVAPPTAVVLRRRRVRGALGAAALVAIAALWVAVRVRAPRSLPSASSLIPPAMAPSAVAPPLMTPSLAPTPATAEAPSRVALELLATPRQARWLVDGEPLGCNPCRVLRETGSTHVAVARAAGFVDARVELRFDRERQERAVLLPTHVSRSAPLPAPQPKHLDIDKESPFH